MPLFPVDLPSEILEKIFKQANKDITKKIISHTEAYISTNKVQFEQNKFRHCDTLVLSGIEQVIKNAPQQSYTRVALWFLVKGREFSAYEKLHFLSIMLMNDYLTREQRVILRFVVDMIKVIEERRISCCLITLNHLMCCAFPTKQKNSKKSKIILNFLYKNGGFIKELKNLVEDPSQFSKCGYKDIAEWAFQKKMYEPDCQP